MPSTYAADSATARTRVRPAPWPTMMPDRIGSIGSTQGENASASPKPKKLARISQKQPLASSDCAAPAGTAAAAGAAGGIAGLGAAARTRSTPGGAGGGSHTP